MLHMACIHAAACDVAIADAGFGFDRPASPSNLDVLASLHGVYKRAEAEFPLGPEAEGLLALMEFETCRLIASRVRGALTCRRTCFAHGLCLWVAAACKVVLHTNEVVRQLTLVERVYCSGTLCPRSEQVDRHRQWASHLGCPATSGWHGAGDGRMFIRGRVHPHSGKCSEHCAGLAEECLLAQQQLRDGLGRLQGTDAAQPPGCAESVVSRRVRSFPLSCCSLRTNLCATVACMQYIGFFSPFPHVIMWALRPDQASGLPDRAQSTQDPATGRLVPSAAGRAASELLQARSLLLAGQAGLCCNPGCASWVHSTSSLLWRMRSLIRQLECSPL